MCRCVTLPVMRPSFWATKYRGQDSGGAGEAGKRLFSDLVKKQELTGSGSR